jgi:phospholipid transport system substrate-binding protein
MKMKTKKIHMLMVITLALCLPFSLQAAPAPQQVIQDASEQVRSILKKKVKKGSKAAKAQKKKLKKIVDKFLDYHELSKRSLGPHWKDRSAEEQTEFTQLLRDLIEEAYTQPISDNIEFTMEYEDEEIAEDGTAAVMAVASTKNKKGKTVSEDLTFHLYLKTKKWMIYDVEFGDVSLVRHYRGEFNRKIKKESYAALIKAMKNKLKEIKSGKVKPGTKPKL